VCCAPGETRDGAGGELLDPLDVVGRGIEHLVQEASAFVGGIGMQRGQGGGVHEVGTELSLALPDLGAAEQGEVVAAGAVVG